MEIKSISRLQFRHHNEVFTGATLEDARAIAIEYIYTEMWYKSPSEECDGSDPKGHSLYAEPTIIKYSVEGDEENAHIILAIGAETNDTNRPENNKFCIIDIDKTEQEIADLSEELEKAIKSLTLSVFDTDSLDLHVEKTEDGTFLSGDVKTSKFHIWNDETKYNSLFIASRDEATGPEGLFIFVDLTYDEITESFTFTTSNYDGSLRDITVKLPNNYLVSGMYSIQDQSLHLKMKNGDDVVVDCNKLIMEWDVEGDASKTPIVLTREQVEYDGSDEYHHLEPWQDVLRADVRITSGMPHNILEKADNGETLYVKGTADNINYHWNGEETTVQEQLNKFNKICKAYQDSDNIINLDNELGFFASARLEYVSDENKLVFTTSSVNGGEVSEEITLNTVEIIESITYDPVTERLILKYKNDKGEEKTVYIPVSGLIDEWTVLNDGHSVSLVKSEHHTSGKDILTADVNISTTIENNILEERGEGNLHALYVKGTADNIKYGNETVQDAIDELKAEDETINARIDDEISRATGEEERIEGKLNQEITDRIADVERIDTTIGDGFSTDAHETVTYKFNELQTKVNSEADKLQAEINRSTDKDTEHDGRLDAIDAEIGGGFGPRNTVRDEIDNLQSEIDAVSADSSSRLSDVINEDESIDVETRADAAGKPTVKVVKVNLSTEVEDGKQNIIKLNSDGLYAGVDLSYEETANKLIFKTTNGTKEIQLESMSSIISIEYNPTKEAIVITYLTNGHEIKTVEIPVGDLINEWRVEDGHPHAVQLEKVRIASGTSEQDVLKASVIITDAHEDNMLVMDNGALYVSNSGIVANAAAISSLDDRMGTSETDIDSLKNSIREEISARTRADEALGARIDQEIEDRNADVNAEQNRALSAETALQTAINDETQRATNAESQLNTTITSRISETATVLSAYTQTSVNEEKTRAMTAEVELRQAIQDETARANAADQLLQDAIDDEVTRSTEKDNEHDAKLSSIENTVLTLNSDMASERTRAMSAETAISTALNTEISDRISGDTTILNLINGEIVRATNTENDLKHDIDENKVQFKDTTSIDFESETPTVGVGSIITADVKLQEGDNIIKIGQGLYATAHLNYNPGTNTIRFTTSAGESGTTEEFQLSAGSIIDNMYYDENTGELVITYHNSEGGVFTVRFDVSELFNPWVAVNSPEGSAIELTKTPGAEKKDPDELSGRVLIANIDDNLVQIINNGLYVSGEAVGSAGTEVQCALNEIASIEKNILGLRLSGHCGEGEYEQQELANYIKDANSFMDADKILDKQLHIVSGNVESLLSASGSCTPSARLRAEQQGLNKVLKVDVILSSGTTYPAETVTGSIMTEDDIMITTYKGKNVEPGDTLNNPSIREFADTNVLRIVNIAGSDPAIASVDGVYLSNYWNCGKYYQESTEQTEIDDMVNVQGYLVSDYLTDEDGSASDYDYNNNVRQ